MNASRVICLAVATVALSACASMPRNDVAKTPMVQSFDSRYDLEYMKEVERRSARQGVIIKWVNPPLLPRDAPKG